MNAGQYQHLINGLFTKLNRISKLSKYAKQEIHNILDEELSEQENEIAHSRFTSMIEQIEELTKEIKDSYIKLNNEEA